MGVLVISGYNLQVIGYVLFAIDQLSSLLSACTGVAVFRSFLNCKSMVLFLLYEFSSFDFYSFGTIVGEELTAKQVK